MSQKRISCCRSSFDPPLLIGQKRSSNPSKEEGQKRNHGQKIGVKSGVKRGSRAIAPLLTLFFLMGQKRSNNPSKEEGLKRNLCCRSFFDPPLLIRQKTSNSPSKEDEEGQKRNDGRGGSKEQRRSKEERQKRSDRESMCVCLCA